MDKKDVSHLLEQIAAFLELKGENPFRIRAYHTAARTIASFHGDLAEALRSGELAELKGVGPATLDIISEALETGRASIIDELHKEVPAGLVEMMKISGLGVTKIRQIHENLGITTLAELEEAARDGRLASLPRFGAKTAGKIFKSLQFMKQGAEFKLLHHALAEGLGLARALAELDGVERVEVAGSVRRRREIIRDIDLVVQMRGPGAQLADRLTDLVGVSEFVGQGEGTFTLRFASETVADVFTTPASQFGFELVRATGSEEHIKALATRASDIGLEWSDTGLRRDGGSIACPSETDLYRALDMDYIPPELREGNAEIAAAVGGTLPNLVERSDIRGFLHCHSNYSDGTSSISEWAEAALEAGYEYIGVTDHSAAAMYAGGLRPESIAEQHAEIDSANRTGRGVTVLKGIELDILEDGSLDYDDETRARFDFAIASVHARLGHDTDQMTARILKAMDDPHMAILGHPTGRLLLTREPYPMDLDRILEKAAAVGVAIEINAHPQRLDLDWRSIQRATSMGVVISIGADAHSTAGMPNMDLGIAIARKGWLTAEHILNTRSLEGFLEHVRRRREGS